MTFILLLCPSINHTCTIVENYIYMLLLQKHELAPNVMAMVGAFNRVALLVPTEILQETTPQARAKVISVFIQVGIYFTLSPLLHSALPSYGELWS